MHLNKDELDDVTSLCKLEEIGGTTGEFAVWINIVGSD
jgi:hypothetical protein